MDMHGEVLSRQLDAAESAGRLQDALDAYWHEALATPALAAEMAATLGIPPAALLAIDAPPVQVEPPRSNAAPSDVALIVVTWLASEVVLGVFKDIAKEELKRRLGTLWDRHLSPALDRRLGRNATGQLEWPALATDGAGPAEDRRP